MIIYKSLNVKQILLQGKKFSWPIPDKCPKCKGQRLWGHGYVRRYFDGIKEFLWIKRYRCPDCKSVHTLRPEDFWRRFQVSREKIVQCLKEKIMKNKWQNKYSRQQQQYWFRGLKKQLFCDGQLDYGEWLHRTNNLLKKMIIISTHSICDINF